MTLDGETVSERAVFLLRCGERLRGCRQKRPFLFSRAVVRSAVLSKTTVIAIFTDQADHIQPTNHREKDISGQALSRSMVFHIPNGGEQDENDPVPNLLGAILAGPPGLAGRSRFLRRRCASLR